MSKHIIISGANGNLGKQVVAKFLNEKWQVTALVQPGTYLEAFAGNELLEVAMTDLNNEAEVAQLVNQIAQKKPIDACAMLAGGFAMESIAEATHEKIATMINLNFFTAYHLAQAVFLQMQQGSGGRLVFIGARPALDNNAAVYMPGYALSKSLLFKLSEILNAAGKEKNIVSTVVVPSIIDTPVNRAAMPNENFSKWVSPESLANIIYLACSEAGKDLREPVMKVYGES
jgi:NAD(P)-dependent dehydrogenase (short-subunit alcohol dehydrogenase family)